MMGRRSAESDQPVPPALLPRKACLGEEFLPKLHIQPERSLGLTTRTPRDRWSAPGRGGAPTPPNPAEARDCHHLSSFADLAKVGRSVRSKMSASEPSIAEVGEFAQTTRTASITPLANGDRKPVPRRPHGPPAVVAWKLTQCFATGTAFGIRFVPPRERVTNLIGGHRAGGPNDGVSTALEPWPH